ncbi:MAG: 3-methyl-2-oxobutanoate hydroxymethyltransferase [Duodenibacillus sp.]|nr:3-methyl-2-oxobutanoate hydroxymethyltransferase [Duodenibacillus sp.]
MKTTVTTLLKMKASGEKISMLTCYDYTMARLMDEAKIECLLVGDSLGQVVLGYETPLSVTLDDMIHHAKAVVRGAKQAFVVVDMPFMTYQVNAEQALVNAGRLIQETGAQAVKLEGGEKVAPQIAAIVSAGIPVVAHIGLTPQSVHQLGGYKVQGKTQAAAQQLLDDARAVEAAGACAVVLECVPAALAAKVSERLSVPTIGIGAGAGCDGQVLVWQDMLGMFKDFQPKFVKQFAQVGDTMQEAFARFRQEVREGSFPEAVHSFTIDEDVLSRLY